MAKGDLSVGTLSGYIELEDKMSGALDIISNRLDKFDAKLGGVGSRVAESAAGFFTAEAALNALSSAAGFISDRLGDLENGLMAAGDLRGNFENLTTQAGLLSDVLLNELRTASHNTITDFDLIKRANENLSAGLKLSEEQFGLLAEGAFALANATGVDTVEALNTMNDAMVTGRTRAIQMLTGKIDLAKAEEDYARTLGVSVDKLTEEGKLQAARNAILASVGAAVGRLGEQTDGLDERIAQAQVTYQNFMDELGRTIAESPVVMEMLDSIGAALTNAFGTNQEEAIRRVVTSLEDVAITSLEVAQYISDAVGIAGMTWNSFQVILETSVQGWRAITIVVEEVLLGLAKLANFVSADTVGDNWIKSLEGDLERLYGELAAGEERIKQHKQESEGWAQSTGRVNEQLEALRQRMIDARGEQEANTAAGDVLAANQEKLAATATAWGKAQETTNHAMAQTKEEAKKQADALAEIASAGKTWQETLAGVDKQLISIVKQHLAAGVSASTLATAYGLTNAQMTAVQKSLKEEEDQLKKNQKSIEETGKLWRELATIKAEQSMSSLDAERAAVLQWQADQVAGIKGVGEAYEKHYAAIAAVAKEKLSGIGVDFEMLRANSRASLEDTAAAAEATYQYALMHGDQFTSAFIDGLQAAAEQARTAATNWEQTLDNVGKKADDLKRKLNGVYQETLQMGGSFNVEPLTARQIQQQGGQQVLEREVEAFEQEFAQWPGRKPGGNGPTGIPPNDAEGWRRMLERQVRYLTLKASGFRTGGVGNFGAGTLTMLHGKEVIAPFDKFMDTIGGARGSGINNFYVNGTAEDVAHKISDILMRQARRGRQFGTA